MLSALERITGLDRKGQGPAFLVASGHGATHWLLGTFYVLLPYITRDLGLSYTQAGGLVTLFHVAAFAANAGSGAVVDIGFRHVQVQAASLFLGAFSLLAFAFAERLLWLVPLVVLLGATNNLWHPAAIAYLSSRYPRNRGYALSIHTLGASFGDMLAPVAAGALLSLLSWQATALLCALPAALVALLLLAVLGRGAAQARESGEEGSVRDYLRRLSALVGNRAMLGLCTMAGFRSMTQNGVLVFIPLYLADVLKVSPVVLGFVLMGMQVGGMIAGPVAGTLSDALGRQPVVFAGITAATLIIIGLTLVSTPALFILLVTL
ncbi:MAG: MFS transporter, partial [Alphaproteobacteria bacterium]